MVGFTDEGSIDVDRDGVQQEILDDARPDDRFSSLNPAGLGCADGRNSDRQGRFGKIPVIPQPAG